MAEDYSTSQVVSEAFMRKLIGARDNLRSIAYLSVMGGVFALAFTLMSAHSLGLEIISLQRAAFLVAGAVTFAIGLGLLNFSDGARAAGSQWLLAWGILEVIAGSVAVPGDMPMGVFCVVGGLIQIMFARLLRRPAETFVTMVGADFSDVTVEEGLLKAAEIKHPAMQAFLRTALLETPPEDVQRMAG